MTWLQIIVLIVAGLGLLTIFGAVYKTFAPGPDYFPMSPDEEYRWLTKDIGLSHEEAMEYRRPIGRG